MSVRVTLDSGDLFVEMGTFRIYRAAVDQLQYYVLYRSRKA